MPDGSPASGDGELVARPSRHGMTTGLCGPHPAPPGPVTARATSLDAHQAITKR
jgi:hypothetical protein